MRKPLLSLLIQHLAVLAMGISIFLIDKFEQFSDHTNYMILMTLAVGKSIYFLAHNFRSVRLIKGIKQTYNTFLTVMSINILLILVSFAIDYYTLYQIYPQTFSGILAASSEDTFVEFLYFSLVTFTTTGFGDIVPRTNEARILISMEIILAFISIIFIISNFGSLAEHVQDESLDDTD
ncbi:MAG: potassium channel family protein [Saprospiraceae bacterium]|nr:potassium channel family protein [Saprospiraceae bacterium]